MRESHDPSFLYSRQEKKKNKKLSFIFFCLGINVAAIPMSYFIGGMATNAPDSTMLDFYKGFLFIQGIPLLLFIISISYLFGFYCATFK